MANVARGRGSMRGRAPFASRVALAFASSILLLSSSARALEPWSDPDPAGPPKRTAIGDGHLGLRGGAEYRANGALVRPLDLAGTRDRNYGAIEHRLRLDGGIDHDDKIRLQTSVDVMDGVLWGDNGTVADDAEPTTGANLGTVNPNASVACMRVRAGEPTQEPSSYRYGLCPGTPVYVRRFYGDLLTPVGLFRIGRQPFTEGASIAVNDGDGRRNRWGFARRGNSADRILFATKPLEAFKPKGQRDASESRGVFLILAYDRLVTDDPQRFRDDLHGTIAALRWLEPTHALGSDLEARLYHALRHGSGSSTTVNAVGGRLMSKLRHGFAAGLEAAALLGSTREVSEAFRVVTADPVVDQSLRQLGARAVVRYDRPKYTLYLEGDYASGDSDPNVRSPLTQFRFADDTNVGLLMFEHVLAYQSARAAAAGVSLLRDLGAPSYPTDQIATRGAFTNAAAIFPQLDVRPVDGLMVRAGALFAWAPAKVVDPLRSLQRRDGNRVEDDLVNFAGGAPGRFYGTELDLRVQYRMLDHFVADLEGAVLFPGSALEDANGDAVRSFMGQARGTFYF